MGRENNGGAYVCSWCRRPAQSVSRVIPHGEWGTQASGWYLVCCVCLDLGRSAAAVRVNTGRSRAAQRWHDRIKEAR